MLFTEQSKREERTTSRKQVQEWLSQQDVYTFHKPAQRRYKSSWVIVPGIDAQFQVDLVNLQNLSRYNKGYKHLLTGIDIFKYAFVWRQYKVKNWSKPFKRSFLLVANLPNCKQIKEQSSWMMCSRNFCVTTTLTFLLFTLGSNPHWLSVWQRMTDTLRIHKLNTFYNLQSLQTGEG